MPVRPARPHGLGVLKSLMIDLRHVVAHCAAAWRARPSGTQGWPDKPRYSSMSPNTLGARVRLPGGNPCRANPPGGRPLMARTAATSTADPWQRELIPLLPRQPPPAPGRQPKPGAIREAPAAFRLPRARDSPGDARRSCRRAAKLRATAPPRPHSPQNGGINLMPSRTHFFPGARRVHPVA
jgi:hypothetical protein